MMNGQTLREKGQADRKRDKPAGRRIRYTIEQNGKKGVV